MKYEKYFKVTLRLSIMIALIALMYCSWAIHRQDIDQIFWDRSRPTNIIGFIFLVVGWGFWEFYATSKTQKMWIPIVGILGILIAIILINGLLGLIAGFIGIALVITAFLLDKFEILTLSGKKGA